MVRQGQLALSAVAAFVAGWVTNAPVDARARPERPAACPATRVHGNAVRAGAFTGFIAPDYDVVRGRFRLRVGGERDAGLSQKIPWFARRGSQVGPSLRVAGTRRDGRRRTFVQVFRRAGGGRSSGRAVFPSIIRPPAEGCWRLRFSSGRTVAGLTVLVRDGRPRS